MGNTLIKNSKSLKCGSIIKPLSTLAFVCTALSCIAYFFYYDYDYVNGEYVRGGLTFAFPNFISLISLLLTIAPVVLFILYIFKFHNKLKATVLVPIIFGLLGLNAVFNVLFGYDYFAFILPYEIYRILGLVMPVCSIIAIISAFKGFSKKTFIIISMSVFLLYRTLYLLEAFVGMQNFIENARYLYVFTIPMEIIGKFALYVSLLLFGLKNRIPAIRAMSPEQEKKNSEKMSPEQALRQLNDKLEFGMITEEEYQTQRAEIISKL